MGESFVVSGTGGLVRSAEPEGVEGGGVAELIGSELQQGFAATCGPELFAPLDAAADLFDGGLDVAGSDRQTSAAVGRVVPAGRLVRQVGPCVREDFPRVGLGGVFRERAKFCQAARHFRDDTRHFAWPDPGDPADVDGAAGRA